MSGVTLDKKKKKSNFLIMIIANISDVLHVVPLNVFTLGN